MQTGRTTRVIVCLEKIFCFVGLRFFAETAAAGDAGMPGCCLDGLGSAPCSTQYSRTGDLYFDVVVSFVFVVVVLK